MARRRGWLLLLVGPDGTGKSTAAQILVAELRVRGRTVSHQHYRPNVLFRREADAAATTSPHASEARSTAAGAVKLAITALDTWWGLRKAMRNADVVLVERGWWDQVVDPARYRLQRSTRAAACVGRLLPKADIVVHLTGDMELVAARKSELCLEELRRQDGEWASVVPKTGRDHLRLSTTCAVEETTSVLRGVADALAEPTWWLKRLRPSPRRLALRASDARPQTLFIYRPQTRRARVALRAARGLTFAFFRRRPAVLAAVGAHIVGERPDATSILQGSFPGRRVVGWRSPRSDAVLKINDRHDPGLASEIAILGTVASLREFAPEVIASGAVAGISYLVTRRVVPKDGQTAPRLDEIAAMCARLQAESDPVIHGDMTPWNLLQSSERLVLLDWEAATRRAAPVYDLCFYLVSAGALLGSWSPGEVATILRGRLIPLLSNTLGVGLADVTHWTHETLVELSTLPDARGTFARACGRKLTGRL